MDVWVVCCQVGYQVGEVIVLLRLLKVIDQYDNLGKGRMYVEICLGLNCFDIELVCCKSEIWIVLLSVMEKFGVRECVGYRYILKIGLGVVKVV